MLLYGLEVCPLSKTDLRSLDFPINRFFMKSFNTSDMQIVTECQSIFDFRSPSVIIPDRFETFHVKYESCNNSLYKLARNICCFCNLNALFTVYFVSDKHKWPLDNLAYRSIAFWCLLYTVFLCFVFTITRWWIKLLIAFGLCPIQQRRR